MPIAGQVVIGTSRIKVTTMLVVNVVGKAVIAWLA